MRFIRVQFVLLTVLTVAVSTVAVGALSVFFVSGITGKQAEDVLRMEYDALGVDYLTALLICAGTVLVLFVCLSIDVSKRVIRPISRLSAAAYRDALTSVRNKGAFEMFMNDINKLIKSAAPGSEPQFAICMFDCNGLKNINDTYGHDKGDIYLKNACSLICKIFRHSTVFRIGGDEFACLLQNEDYMNLDDLAEAFRRSCREICETAKNEWDKTDIAFGVASYDPAVDASADDVMNRADRLMYEDKAVNGKRREYGRNS